MTTAPTGAFGPGEQIIYKVSWLGLPAGTADVTVGVETPEHPGTLPIVTNGRSDLVIYPIRNKIISWWDPASGRSRGLEMYQDENHKRRRVRIGEVGPGDLGVGLVGWRDPVQLVRAAVMIRRLLGREVGGSGG